MKKVKTKNITKQIICIIVVLMLCNFIIPNITYAASDEDSGTIFAPFSKFITYLCDSMMQFLQNTFVSTESIKVEKGVWDFKYSPAIIFSGIVPAFDVNFIKPNNETETSNGYRTFIKTNVEKYFNQTLVSGVKETEYYSYLENAKKHEGYRVYKDDYKNEYWTGDITVIYYEEVRGEDTYFCMEFFVTGNYNEITWSSEFYYRKFEEQVTEDFCEELNDTTTYESTASKLHSTVATWYNALRRIALVGLLSVLVYVGIQIILSTASGKENSKYKNMLIDWLIAICLLFTLHYIMNATLVVTQKISSLFNNGETDKLLNTLRNKIDTGKSWEEVTTTVIMYLIMTIYTVIFSFKYLKRVLYMGFFTIIAPLVTLTYPLDKIKDGQAQAFTMWIREYVFNALIQVVHLVVYYTLVGSALSLVETYPIYAIIAIGFMTQGEKIIRKMFGFDNATTVGAVGAAATGGLVAAAMNKLQKASKPSKDTGDSKQSSNSNIRTVSNNKSNGNGVRGGALALTKKYHKKVGGAVLGAGLGATGAIAGFASGVAQGDVSAALTGAVAGGAAGKGVGQRLANGVNVGKIKSSINNVKNTFNEGAYGTAQAQNMAEMREFKSGSTYKSLKEKYGENLTDDKLSAMLQAGISRPKDMEKVLGSSNVDDAIGYYTLAQSCPDDIYYDDEKLQIFLEDLELSKTDAETMRKNMKEFRH